MKPNNNKYLRLCVDCVRDSEYFNFLISGSLDITCKEKNPVNCKRKGEKKEKRSSSGKFCVPYVLQR